MRSRENEAGVVKWVWCKHTRSDCSVVVARQLGSGAFHTMMAVDPVGELQHNPLEVLHLVCTTSPGSGSLSELPEPAD